MPFCIGEHQVLEDINEKDIMSIALDLDVSLEVFDKGIKEILDGLLSFDTSSKKIIFY